VTADRDELARVLGPFCRRRTPEATDSASLAAADAVLAHQAGRDNGLRAATLIETDGPITLRCEDCDERFVVLDPHAERGHAFTPGDLVAFARKHDCSLAAPDPGPDQGCTEPGCADFGRPYAEHGGDHGEAR
jgi:hypothetical protein